MEEAGRHLGTKAPEVDVPGVKVKQTALSGGRSWGTCWALTSPVVAIGSRAGVGVGAAAIRVPVPARREDPCWIHGEAAPIAGG